MKFKILLTFFLLMLFFGIIQAQSFSNLEKDRLTGSVKTVRKEQTWTTRKNGEYVEGEKVLMTVDTYDKNGNKTEWVGYFGKENPIRFVFVCDDKGKLVKEFSYNSIDELDAQTVYKYNADETLAEEIISNGIKTVYSYDSKKK